MRKSIALIAVAAAMTLSACAHEVVRDTRQSSFTLADANKDNRLNYGEYKVYLTTQADLGDKTAQKILIDGRDNVEKAKLKAFQAADLNRDTFITWDEASY
jgi:hypothetical protein